MSNITLTPNQKITLDLSGRKGLTPKWGGDIGTYGFNATTQKGQPNLRYLTADGSMAGGVYSPVAKYGFLTPAVNFPTNGIAVSQSGFATTLTHPVSASLVDPIQNIAYFFSISDKFLMQGTYGVTGWTDLAPGSVVILDTVDACNYFLNGVPTTFISTITSDVTNPATIMTYNGATLNEDWSWNDATGKFTMTNSKAFKLLPSGNGYMYILNGNAVHMLDGTTIGGANGTLTKNVLLAPGTTSITHGVEYNNYIYLAIQNNDNWSVVTNQTMLQTFSAANGQVGIYIWNKQQTFANSSNFINIPGVDHLRNIWVSAKNELFVMCVLPDGSAQIMQFDGSKFVTVQSLPFGAYPIRDDALQVYGNYTYWAAMDGYVYCYGSELTDSSNSLTIFTQYSSTVGLNNTGSTAMFIVSSPLFVGTKKPSTDVMYIAGQTDAGVYTIKAYPMFPVNTVTIGGSAYNQQQHPGNIYTGVRLLPTLSNTKHINVFMAANSAVSGTQKEAAIDFYFNGSDTLSFTKYVTRDDIKKGYVSYEINKPYANSIQLGVRYFNAANLNPDGLYSNIGVADFSPSYAELYYQPTSTLH